MRYVPRGIWQKINCQPQQPVNFAQKNPNVLYIYASIVYLICFALFVLFSRQPNFNDSETTPGRVVAGATLADSIARVHHINKSDWPIVEFKVEKDTYYINGNNNMLLKLSDPKGRVKVIYNPSYPQNAAVYQLQGYWLLLGELLFSIAGYAILLGIAVAISGKNQSINNCESPTEHRSKYN